MGTERQTARKTIPGHSCDNSAFAAPAPAACGPYPMGEHWVKIFGHPYIVTMDQHQKTVWIARGVYMGEPLEVKGRTEAAAVKRWCDAARSKGNR